MNQQEKEAYLKGMGRRVKEKREQLGLSQEELANRLGYKSKTSINKIEMGIQGVPQRKMRDFAKTLKTSIEFLMDGTEGVKEKKSVLDVLFDLPGIRSVPETKQIPMLGSISCGEPIFANQEYSYVEGPIKADFCLTAEGDSMTGARIHDGDIVFCRAQEEVPDGSIAAVLIGDQATLKRFYYYPDRDLVILKPENPAYSDQIYMGSEIEQVRVLGKAIAFQSSIQ